MHCATEIRYFFIPLARSTNFKKHKKECEQCFCFWPLQTPNDWKTKQKTNTQATSLQTYEKFWTECMYAAIENLKEICWTCVWLAVFSWTLKDKIKMSANWWPEWPECCFLALFFNQKEFSLVRNGNIAPMEMFFENFWKSERYEELWIPVTHYFCKENELQMFTI